jgi:hypothetical protein
MDCGGLKFNPDTFTLVVTFRGEVGIFVGILFVFELTWVE